MLKILYKPSFTRHYRKFPDDLKAEIKEKIALFRQDPHHVFLKTHKLHGPWKNKWSFSVNYKHRIVFEYLPEDRAVMVAIGDHEIYK